MTIESWLRRQKIRPSAFARQIGMSHTTVLRWIEGSSVPSPAAMRAVFEATGGDVTANDLIHPPASLRKPARAVA